MGLEFSSLINSIIPAVFDWAKKRVFLDKQEIMKNLEKENTTPIENSKINDVEEDIDENEDNIKEELEEPEIEEPEDDAESNTQILTSYCFSFQKPVLFLLTGQISESKIIRNK